MLAGVCIFWSDDEISFDKSLRPRAGEGGTHAGWVRDSLILHQENNPSPPASPYPLPWERAVINCGAAVNPNVETRHKGGTKDENICCVRLAVGLALPAPPG